jgi:hypothetical protein
MEAWSFDNVQKRGPEAFFDANFGKWKLQKQTGK